MSIGEIKKGGGKSFQRKRLCRAGSVTRPLFWGKEEKKESASQQKKGGSYWQNLGPQRKKCSPVGQRRKNGPLSPPAEKNTSIGRTRRANTFRTDLPPKKDVAKGAGEEVLASLQGTT